jgi:hypothetical protein
MPIPAVTPFHGTAPAVFPDAAAGAAMLAGAANTYGNYVAVSGALAVDSVLVRLTLDTPAVNIEPCEWELSHGAAHTVIATDVIGFGTAVGTYPPIELKGEGGLIDAGETISLRIRTATGATTCNAHLSTMPAL